MLNIGDYVKINNTNLIGYIVNFKKKDYYVININDKYVLVNSSNVSKLEDSKNENKNTKKNNVTINITKSSKEFCNELMIRHQTLNEALINIEQYISDALYNNCKQIKIIHGKHGGVLRKAVHDYLKSCPYVKDFRLGEYFEGSYGVTIVNLK